MPPKKQLLSTGQKVVATNRRARHDYEILEVHEAGLVLFGAEVKSLRMPGGVQLREAFARVDGGECYIHGLHLAPYEYAKGFGQVDPDRARKLLLHKDEITKLGEGVAQKGLSIVPLSIYWKDGRAKVEIALARGRHTFDKRHAIAKRDLERDEARARRTRA